MLIQKSWKISRLLLNHTTLKDATNRGVIAIFGEKYNPEKVRIVEVPGFSAELCGGTHVRATGDIGSFKITEVSALSAGNRRIVAVTGPGAVQLFQQSFAAIKTLGQEFKVPADQVLDAIKKQREALKEAQTAIKELKKNMYHHLMPEWIKRCEKYKAVPVLYLSIKDASSEDLRDIAQEFMKVQPGLYFLVGQTPARATYFVSVAPTLAHHINMKDFAEWLKSQGLQGGGSGTTLQGGAPQIGLEFEYNLKKWLQEHIQ